MNWAILENGIVVNIIVADESFIEIHFPNAVNITDTTAGIGWTYDGEVFTAPPAPIEETDESISE